ncbi:Phosphate transport system permease protein PstA [Sporotomaculum syntrophicum]|uniref:Phosphate transport system permease protein PstA n=1 Tax=Sporotomaculum syntrophicum TaxID=182264 RepID=A0A9D2WSE3_9FIRM|nr:phosphate ABC transporter permease PstA [Sporotomaculum syntrophicum]KAF1086715.1 Phosphate transport system permease protein PstA [Sporotomaculum syntrophicum]
MMNKRLKEKAGFGALAVLTFLAVVPVLAIIGYLVWQGWPALTWEFLTQPPRKFLTEGGIYPAIIGTLALTVGTIMVAMPLGIGTAIYLVEYAGENVFTKLIRIAIINLAGVPSVVYGLFGMGMFVLTLGLGRSLAVGALTLGILTLPIIISTAEEALLAVPDSYRYASLALGATKWQTVRRVVLPVALPAILTGTILGIGRAAGETAPIMFTAAVVYTPRLPDSIYDQVMALPYHLYAISTEVPNVSQHMAFGAALVLLAIVGAMNLVAVVIRTRMRLKRLR